MCPCVLWSQDGYCRKSHDSALHSLAGTIWAAEVTLVLSALCMDLPTCFKECCRLTLKKSARRCSHSNLQALREIDARGVSFLRCSSQGGDSRLLVESPDYGLLSAEDSAHADNTIQYVPSSRESCQAGSAKGNMSVGQPLSYQIGFVTH